MRKKLSSLKYRIAITVFFLEAVMLSVVLWNTFNFIEIQAQDDLNARHKVTIDLIKKLSANSIFSEEYDDLQQYIEKISEDREIINIAIINNKGITIAHNNFQKVGERLKFEVSTPDHYMINESISGLGSIAVEFSLARIKSQMQKARSMGIGIAVTGMLVIAISGLAFGFILTHKLSNLTKVITDFKESGEYVNIEIDGSDEISVLSNAFNVMSNKINAYIEKIEHDKSQLESRVKERTEALEVTSQHLIKVNEQLHKLSVTDHLTQIFNRIKIEEQIDSENKRRLRYKNKFSVVLLDIDHFKNVNDTYGHDVGDHILVTISKLISDNIRQSDIVGRWGGEEFIIVCQETEIEGAMRVAEHLRELIINTDFEKIGKMTCSFGVTEAIDNDNVNDIIKRSDEALYEAKDAGRNCVIKA